jgi:hypothetical protein
VVNPLWLASSVAVLCSGGVTLGQEAGERPVSGRVVDASAKPVAGAVVRMLSVKTAGDGQEYEVDVATKTDAEGRFKLAVPKRWLRQSTTFRQELGIVAAHDGRMTGVEFSRYSAPPGEGLELVLPATGEMSIAVRSPQGAPVAGAAVTINALHVDEVRADLTEQELRALSSPVKKSPNGYIISRGVIPLPKDLSAVLGKTDDKGRVTTTRIAPEQVGGVQVESAEYGEQAVVLLPWQNQKKLADWPAKITLQPVGRVRGQLVGAPLAVAGREVTVVTNTDANERMFGGRTTVRTDAEGKFDVPKIAIGAVRVLVNFDPKMPDRVAEAKKPSQLKAGAIVDVKLDLKPAVRLTGVVLDSQSKKPVADVSVLAGTEQLATSTFTDADGKFTVWVAPGKVTVLPLIPEGYLDRVPPDKWGSNDARLAAVPKEIVVAVEDVELPPLLLDPEATLRGLVVDEQGLPIKGATVSAVSLVFDHRRGSPRHREVEVTADERGEFAVAGIDPRVEVRLRARAKDASKVVTVAKPGKEPVRIVVTAKEVFRVQGRVLDAKGQAVTGATLELWRRDWRPPPAEAEPKKVALKEPLRTDDTGQFTTPPLLPDGQYRFVIRASGVKTTETAWLDASRPEAAKAQELVVTRLGGLAGVLRDRQGKPVADAQVTLLSGELRVATATNAQGEFKLETPGGKPFCVIARHPDFRVHGTCYEKDPSGLDQVLTRLTEPGDKRPPRTILAKEERQKLLQQLLAPYEQKFLKTASMDEKMRGGLILAKADPDFLVGYADKHPFKPAIMQDSILLMVVKRWLPGRSDDAEELIGKMQTAYLKAMSLCELADAMPDKARAKKLETLAEALVAARAEKSPEFRAIVLGFIGRRLFDLGDKERADSVLREGAKLAGGLSAGAFAGYARGSFATDLALIDLPAALALVKDLKDSHEFRRHHGNIAHRIAALQPAEAVKVLDLIPGPKENEFNERDHYAIRVCYRMAAVDLPRALKLAESVIDVPSRAHALGVIAQAVARKDAKTAADLLRRAYTLLEEDSTRPDPPQLTGPHAAGAIAAVLAFGAEKIDPSLVDECLWRAVALMRTPTEDPQKVWRYQTTNYTLALAATRYDAKLAELLLPAPSTVMQARESLLARFLVHPRRTVEDAANAQKKVLELLGYLAVEEDQIPRLIHHTAGIWWIDTEDIDS